MKNYYTCEMHPEVHQDKPGKCPKCGMKLVSSDSAGGSKASAGQRGGCC